MSIPNARIDPNSTPVNLMITQGLTLKCNSTSGPLKWFFIDSPYTYFTMEPNSRIYLVTALELWSHSHFPVISHPSLISWRVKMWRVKTCVVKVMLSIETTNHLNSQSIEGQWIWNVINRRVSLIRKNVFVFGKPNSKLFTRILNNGIGFWIFAL